MNDYQYMTWDEFKEYADEFKDKLPTVFFYYDDDSIVGVPEIAEVLGVAEETIRAWIRQGKLKVVNPVGRYRVNTGDLKAFLWIHWRNRVLKHLKPNN